MKEEQWKHIFEKVDQDYLFEPEIKPFVEGFA